MSQSCPCKWEDFIKWVMPFVSSPKDEFKRPTNAMVLSFVRKTAYDYAQRTGVLQKEVYVDLQCGVCDYQVPCQGEEDVLSYKQVKYNGNVLSQNDYQVTDDILYLREKPRCDIAEGLCIRYSYAPCLLDDCDVPEEFCSRYREAIITGTVATLLMMPSMDWFSPSIAETFKQDYDRYVSSGKVDVRKRKSSRRANIYDIETRFIR